MKKIHNLKIFIKMIYILKKFQAIKHPEIIFEYFHKSGDISSIQINEDKNGNIVGTGYITYHNQENTKKSMDETNGKKIWDSNMELQYQTSNKNDRNYHHHNYQNYHNNNKFKININNIPDNYIKDDVQKLCEEFGKIQNLNILNGQYGKYARVIFSNEQEVEKALEKLNNKKIDGKKLIVKEYQRKPN